MTPSEADIIYIKFLEEFDKLVKGELKEIKITLYEMSKLDFYSINSKNYADMLREFYIKHNIIETEDLVNSNYIFRLGGNKDE